MLRDGRLVATHNTAQVPVDTLLENMVGRNVGRLFPKIEKPAEKEVLRVDGLTSPNGSFQDVSFTVNAGEVFGIAGIVGAGPHGIGSRNHWSRSHQFGLDHH